MTFYEDLIIPGVGLQIGLLDKVISTTESTKEVDEIIKIFEDDNIYFLGGVSEDIGSRRASDSDVKRKNYVFFDFDIRKSFPDVTDEEIKTDYASKIVNKIEDHLTFCDWRYLVYTGNGLHLYYFCKEPVSIRDTKNWSTGMKKLCRMISDTVGLEADSACVNCGRISRLPGSYNNKQDKKLVEIVSEKDRFCSFIERIEQRGAELRQAEEQKQEEKKREIEAKYSEDTQDTFGKINSLPIGDVVSFVMGWEYVVLPDGKGKWKEPGSQVMSACFVPPGENYIVHGGTSHFPDFGKTGMACYDFVKSVKRLSDRETMFWFKDHFSVVRGEERLETKKSKSGNITSVFERLRTIDFQPLNVDHQISEYDFLMRQMVVRIGAMSFTGKSKFCYFLVHLLCSSGYRGIVFSTEVPAEMVLANLIHIIHPESKNEMEILRREVAVTDETIEQSNLNNLELYDSTSTGNRLEDIEKIIQASIKNSVSLGLDSPSFIVIDFVQMLEPKQRATTEFHAASLYASEIQAIAQKYNILVIDVSQLNNEGFEDKGEKYGYIPFKNSGALYTNADVCIMLKRDRQVSGASPMTVSIRKHKYGKPAEISLEYDYDTGKFTTEDKNDNWFPDAPLPPGNL